MTKDKEPSLSVGNYTIEMTSGGFGVFATKEGGARDWVCTAADPQIAMVIVEGLVLVETKRFYYPDSDPVFKSADEKDLPSFLQDHTQKA